ncbi:hypothetical protein [Chromohalobacter canadensis]|uniref:hypothetical protein n=1 Tax=Chromohalobacter canadensis TaxID=141389 RepID=UPI00240FDBBD|nr:hypothetical protein [Chromohalobacter canadensis]
MNARDYLAKQGIGLDKEEDKPTTLEEQAWARARGAASHRPRSGTPHDWEDWERHHDTLASGADEVRQKIDPDAHSHAPGVEYCDPRDKQ